MTLATSQWTAASAKARFSEMLDRVVSDGPQMITRNGRRTAVVVSIEEWERKTRRTGTLGDFLAASPLGEVADLVQRSRETPRDIDL